MLCQNCQKREAVFHHKRILGGEVRETHLCADCAAVLGLTDFFPGFSFPEVTREKELSSMTHTLRCETCGITYDDILRAGLPGCPDCYRSFSEKLSPYVTRLHGRATYKGEPFPEIGAPVVPEKRWYEGDGPQADVVLGTRVRLGFNLRGVPYPVRLNVAQKSRLSAELTRILSGAGERFRLTEMADLYPYEAVSLAERFLITPDFAGAGAGAALLLSEDLNLSVMLGLEDHVRTESLAGGLDPFAAYTRAVRLRTFLHQNPGLAFDSRLGFLNQNPMEIGTGMRVEAILHLPSLAKTENLPALAATFRKLGFALTGAFGDGLSVKGDVYRLTNTLTMGLSEKESMENLRAVCMQLATLERRRAESYVEDVQVKDRIRRSEALLRSASLLSSDELLDLLSWVRLGARYGLSEIPLPVLGDLTVNYFPATVNSVARGRLSSVDRDALRAKLVQKKLTEENAPTA